MIDRAIVVAVVVAATEIDADGNPPLKDTVARHNRKSHSINDRKRQILTKEVAKTQSAPDGVASRPAASTTNTAVQPKAHPAHSFPPPLQPQPSQNSPTVSVEDLVDCLLEGNSASVEQYLQSLDKPEEEKEKLREQLLSQFELKAQRKGARSACVCVCTGVCVYWCVY